MEGDSARSGVVHFTVDEMAWFSWRGEHDFLFSLVGASSFEFVGCCRDEGGERCGGRGWVQWIIAWAIVIRGHGRGEVAGEGAFANGADALRLVADVLEDFGEAASLGECVAV